MFEQTLTSDALVTTTHNHAAEPTQRPLRDSVQQALRNYLAQLNGQEVIDLYDMVLSEVEAPMLDVIMQYTRDSRRRDDGHQPRHSAQETQALRHELSHNS